MEKKEKNKKGENRFFIKNKKGENRFFIKNKKGYSFIDFIVVLLIALGVLALITVIYVILGGNLSGIASRLKDFFRLGF